MVTNINNSARGLIIPFRQNDNQHKMKVIIPGNSFKIPEEKINKELQQELQNKLKGLQNMVEQMSKSKGADTQISNIEAKLMSGQELTTTELEYLRENSPELYEKAVKVASERKEYQKKLDACKSKEEVMKVKLNKLTQLSDATVPKGAPNALEQNKFVCMRLAAILNEHDKFTNTTHYKDLPEKSSNILRDDNKETDDEKMAKEIDEYA